MEAGSNTLVVQDMTLVGGNIIDNSITNITNNVQPASPRYLRHCLLDLEKHVSNGAAHDSYERGGLDAPKCHPETRAAVQGQVMSWIGYGEQDKTPTTIMWLSGPAGSGKTAIAGSIADACQAKGWLAASFFFSAFSGPPDRRSKRYVIPTLAYHLIQQKTILGLRERILSAIADTPSVFNKRLGEQIEILILQPLRSIPAGVDRNQWPKVIIIDGLDECGDDSGDVEGHRSNRRSQEASQRDLISVLVHASKDPAFPFRIMVISRPEPAIRDAISTSSNTVTRLFLDEKYEPDADITLFLEAKFGEICRRFNIPSSWPSRQDIRTLVEQASGQFIYAATVIRFVFVEDGASPPQERLRRVLEWKTLGGSNPLSALDSLYLGVIRTSPNPPLAVKWLITIPKMRKRQPRTAAWTQRSFIRALLESFPGEMDYLLGNLTSLVDLEPNERGNSFNFYHKSLVDFLDDDRRSAALYAELQIPAPKQYSLPERVVANFIDERTRQIFTNRGPQGTSVETIHGGGNGMALFLERFCALLSETISTLPQYDDTDVDWWWTCLSHRKQTHHQFAKTHEYHIDGMFARIHKDCHWYRCLASCKVWRRGILERCTASGAWYIQYPGGAKKRFIRSVLGKKEYKEGFLSWPSRTRFLTAMSDPDELDTDQQHLNFAWDS